MIQYAEGSTILGGDPDEVENQKIAATAAAAKAEADSKRSTTLAILAAGAAFLWWKYGRKGKGE